MNNAASILRLPKLQTDVPLAPLTYIGIGGPARYFVEATSEHEVVAAVAAARADNVPYFLLGGGSNILIADAGFPGLVIRMAHNTITWDGEKVTVAAGYNLNRLAAQAASKGLAGMEFTMGIPGTVGGAVRGNSGAFHEEMKDIVVSVRALHTGGQIVDLPLSDLHYHYRHSVFHDNNDVILSVTLQLHPGDVAAIQALQKERLEYRRTTQPLAEKTLGSTFTNIPLGDLHPSLHEDLGTEQFQTTGLVPAGFLIDSLGLKGFQIGGAKVSEKHANFFINTGSATAEHVVMLIGVIKQKVRAAYKGLQLKEEIQYVGFAEQ